MFQRRHINLAVASLCFYLSSTSHAAEPVALSDEVKRYVSVDAPTIVLTHVRVIDGSGSPALDDRNLTIENGKIVSIEAGKDVTSTKLKTVLDLRDHTVIPGIVGMHNHLYYIARPNLAPGKPMTRENPVLLPQMTFSAPRLYLASGVTTMRTTGSVEPYADLNLRDQINQGKIPGPHIDVTGPYLEGKDSYFIQMHHLKSPEEVSQFVDYWASVGVTSFKAYMGLTRAQLKAAIDAVHRHGLKITGHLCAVTYAEAAEMGIDNLEHGFFVNTESDPDKKEDECSRSDGGETIMKMDPDGPEAAKLIQTLVNHHVAITSTLPVFEDASTPLQARAMEVLAPQARDAYLYIRDHILSDPDRSQHIGFKHDLKMEKNFVAAGGLLLAGPDPTGIGNVLPGFGDQRGIELLVDAGFSPVEAIRIATLNGAIFEGSQASIGSIETGKNADLVVIKGDPSKHIDDIENVVTVFKDGIGYDSAKLIRSVAGRYGDY